VIESTSVPTIANGRIKFDLAQRMTSMQPDHDRQPAHPYVRHRRTPTRISMSGDKDASRGRGASPSALHFCQTQESFRIAM
jgi:hypothetical protein